MARVKRTYKDSLFCDIFRRKDYLQDVYRGLFGRDVSLQEIQLMTLQGTFFNDEKNDVSFLAGKRQIVLMEHQSTLNENMPLRMFLYMVWRGLLSRQSAIVSSRIFWRNIFLSVRWRRFLIW